MTDFILVTPNWALRMPGAEYDGADRPNILPPRLQKPLIRKPNPAGDLLLFIGKVF